jgi:hypothetical protein
MSTEIWLLLLAAILVGSGLIFWIEVLLARRLVRRWAASHGWELTEDRYAFLRGPFWWSSRWYPGSRNTHVFRVAVVGKDGRTGRGYARCGIPFLGLLVPLVSAMWDAGHDPEAPAQG